MDNNKDKKDNLENQVKKFVDLHTDVFKLPKIDIHAHLNGSIRKSTIQQLLSKEDIEKFIAISNPTCYKDAFDLFKITSKILTDLNVVRRVTREVIEDWSLQNCVYFELRTTPKSIGNSTKEDYINAVLDEIALGNEKYRMKTRLILCIDRAQSFENALELYTIYEDLKSELKNLIVGVDYSGCEDYEHIPHNELFPLFNKFRSLGLGITYHIGEIPDYKMIDFSVFKPDRLSHTYHLSEEDVQKIKINKIPVEVCPTSTMFIFKKFSYSDIHFKYYFEKDREENLVCINTDDTMILNTNITQEYFEIAMAHDLDINDLKNILKNTISFIFEKDEALRSDLYKTVELF